MKLMAWCLVDKKPWTKMILNLAVSFGTPCSMCAKCLPSRSFTLGAVTGGPPSAPQILGGRG
uniref:Catalytic n=1 Tax=Rhizophora mucronata TaxID=61149 RepID=A0A2P2P4B6_RHIMU